PEVLSRSLKIRSERALPHEHEMCIDVPQGLEENMKALVVNEPPDREHDSLSEPRAKAARFNFVRRVSKGMEIDPVGDNLHSPAVRSKLFGGRHVIGRGGDDDVSPRHHVRKKR